MATIVLDEQTGAMPLREIFAHPPDNVVEFCSKSGEIVGTLFLNTTAATPEEYRELIASAEANMEELLRRANTPRDECVSTAELLARARALAPE